MSAADTRLEAIELLSRSGWTLDRIGEAFSLTRERIRQLIAHVPVDERGSKLLAAERKAAREQQRINDLNRRIQDRKDRAMRNYGCSPEMVIEVNGGPLTRTGCAAYSYRQQKRGAEMRRVPWGITFPEWWVVWDASGKWDLRGRGKGKYCMGRKGDIGPYAVGNVEIITVQQNSSDFYKYYPRTIRDELGLTPREREIHNLTQFGLGPKEIAEKLGIRANSVSVIRSNIKRQLRQI